MKITCQACAAKYTIADDKVLGKVVKIRCKKCGATIVVNGNDAAAAEPAHGPESARAFDYSSPAVEGESWTVNVADGDQRTMTDGEVVEAYHAGVVNDETFCWKDGMSDWLPIREVDALYAACNATRAMVAPSFEATDMATKVQVPGPALLANASAAAQAAPRPAAGVAAGGGNGTAVASAPTASAAAQAATARRVGGRSPGADLFGGAAQAGGEDDVMTSAPVGAPQAHQATDDSKLTGERNENSVLFSLNALTSKDPGSGPGGAMTATSEASGLIDIRQLSSQIGIDDKKKKSRVDDIMNLAGGGAFSPALSAPMLAAPPIEEYSAPAEAMPGATAELAAVSAGKSKALIFGAIGASVVVVAGAIGLAVMFMGGGDKADKDKTSAAASAVGTPGASSALAMNAPPTATTAPAATADTPAANPQPAAAAETSTAKASSATTPTAAKAATPTPRETPTPAPAAPSPPREAPAAAAAAPASDQPFNMGEAKARLAAIAGSVQACKKGDISGGGRVVVTFAPSGNVSSAVVNGSPFEGTPTGGCVAARFRGAHVPPFSGSPFSVSKSFTIN